jgi:hypothetical protein
MERETVRLARMWRIFGGAALVVGGIAAFIEAHSHRTKTFTTREYVYGLGPDNTGGHYVTAKHATSGLSQNAYDLLQIGGWALVVFGSLLVLVGLTRLWRGSAA